MRQLILTFFCLVSTYVSSASEESVAQSLSTKLTVDLREPLYSDGTLSTEKGGVISGPNLRIQALKIKYIRKVENGLATFSIEAEDDLILEFGEYVFVGKKLYYDFDKKEGTIYEGRTSSEPWFFGGEKIDLRPDGSYIIHQGYITTSENKIPEWGLFTSEAHITDEFYIDAKQVQFKFFTYPILWIPSLKLNLNSIFDSPIRYRFGWGGSQGPRIGITYELFAWDRWKTFVRLDYRLTRGPGAGLETYYHSEDHKTEFQSINYLAKDSSLLNPHEKARYRFEGAFKKLMDEDKLTFLLTYDKVSDVEMPGNYYDNNFDFDTSERTQLLIRRQESDWISTFYARVRINPFQTVKQELPSFGVNYRPFVFGPTGIIMENWAKASYLDFKYARNLPHVRNFASSRFEYCPRLYRPFFIGPITVTPEAGAVAIFYGDSPEHESKWMALGIFGAEAQTQLYHTNTSFKHVVKPYLAYRTYTHPTTAPNHHFIFDINDGYYYLNQMTLGVENSLYFKKMNEGCISRPLFLNVFAHGFFDSGHITPTVPKLYGQLIFFLIPTMKQTLETAWDFWHQRLDHFNVRLDWTIDADMAFGAEYRHRSAYSWRKADYQNFFLDSFRTDKHLRHSQLSDERDTILFHAFYRFLPTWALEVSTRNGWNRSKQPTYFEYEIDVLTTIQTAWHLKFTFQHKENDTRFAIYFNIGLNKPKELDDCSTCYFE